MEELRSKYQQLKCCLNTSELYVDEPILMSCGHTACKKCIENFNKIQIRCSHCKTVHKKEDMMMMLKINESSKLLLIENLKKLKDFDLKIEDSKSLKGCFFL
jgi:hypothetical protein